MENNISLYIHYPFCVRKCPYCDFNSHKTQDNYVSDIYLKALLDDFNNVKHYLQNRKLISIFIGGGTPSLESALFYKKLLKEIYPYTTSDCEITIEANPGTVTYDKLSGYIDAGINRISLGIQSFNDSSLKALGRIHDKKMAEDAISFAKKANFLDINFDIMHSLPNQTLDMAMYDLERAHELGCTHLSWYELTIEEGTHFYENTPKLPDEDLLFDIEEKGFELLKSFGFNRYEVSAFYKKSRCRHNENYWLYGDYLGIGCGAHSKVSFENQILRRACPNLYDDYIKDFGQYSKVELQDIPFEYMLNRLRLFDAIDIDEFTKATNLPFICVEDKIKKAQEMSLIKFDTDRKFSLTNKGKIMLNEILDLFL